MVGPWSGGGGGADGGRVDSVLKDALDTPTRTATWQSLHRGVDGLRAVCCALAEECCAAGATRTQL
jgi:hypothetical protein